MDRHFFHIDFLNESETEELCKQKIKGWLFCVFDENEICFSIQFQMPFDDSKPRKGPFITKVKEKGKYE